jgi:tetratricopeptide (TPR) repeat protein
MCKKHPLIGTLCLILALDGCTAPSKNQDKAAKDPQSSAPETAATAPAPQPQDEARKTAATRPAEEALSLWHDPAFRRAVERSYKAETDIEPPVSAEERQRLQQAFELISNDKLTKATGRLRDLRGPDATAVYDFTLGNIHFQRNELEKAVETYRKAVEKFNSFRRAWSNLGKIHTRRQKYEKGVEALTRVIELGGGDGLTYGLLGFCHSKTGQSLSAESAYRRAILLDSETTDWQLGLARAFFEQERYAEAATLLGQLVEKDPNRADLWKLQARAHIGMEKPRKAAQNYELLRTLGKADADELTTLGDIYVKQELFDPAVEAYTAAMERDPNQRPDRAVRAVKVMAARGAYEPAKRMLSRLEKGPMSRLSEKKRKELLKVRARVAVAEGKRGEQARILERIVKLDPTDGEALMLLGRHQERQDNLAKAKFYYERAAKIEGTKADAKVRHAQVLVQQEKYKAAVDLLRAAQKIQRRENVQKYLEQVQRMAQKG